jgi:hypothetical protein
MAVLVGVISGIRNFPDFFVLSQGVFQIGGEYSSRRPKFVKSVPKHGRANN